MIKNIVGESGPIKIKDGDLKIKLNGDKLVETLPIKDHSIAVELLLKKLIELKVVNKLDEIDGVGHRVVHGGEKFSDSVVITDEVIHAIEAVSDLAPLHNPANLKGIMAMKNLIPGIKQVAVFDTAFHQTMPEHAYMYAIPYSLYNKYKIRRYGFHGTR